MTTCSRKRSHMGLCMAFRLVSRYTPALLPTIRKGDGTRETCADPWNAQDCYNVKGQATTIGFVSYLGKPKKEKNSPIVDVLLENGALIYLKTNVPQTMMVWATPLSRRYIIIFTYSSRQWTLSIMCLVAPWTPGILVSLRVGAVEARVRSLLWEAPYWE